MMSAHCWLIKGIREMLHLNPFTLTNNLHPFGSVWRRHTTTFLHTPHVIQ
ncbi:hypothetical protein GLYMA_04G166400v4 [Glycine max]|uniref:Uncharacterized protein n=1 Tax=Glycine max TaxID=3847 RepID=A0A0R0KG76_SOYBN|nr:hypothetical protein GYH30_010176 [Glycine max]KRH63299.1 hypothetical protein GLYMA_04G166400v4 [Glycine max]